MSRAPKNFGGDVIETRSDFSQALGALLLLVVGFSPNIPVDAEVDATINPTRDVFSHEVRQEPASLDGTVRHCAPLGAAGDSGVRSIDAAREHSASLGSRMLLAEAGDERLEAVLQDDASEATLSIQVTNPNDVLASYLVNVSPPGWNVFSGASIPLGRHFDPNHVSYFAALRFTGVSIPKGTMVRSARLSFFPAEEVDSSQALWLNIYAEKAGDSLPFDPTQYDSGRPDQRLRSDAFIDHWLVRCNRDCNETTEYDCRQRKLDCWNHMDIVTVPKDLAALVQEIVDLPSWESGNSLTLLLINAATDADGPKYQGSRSVTGVDLERGLSYSPRLLIDIEP